MGGYFLGRWIDSLSPGPLKTALIGGYVLLVALVVLAIVILIGLMLYDAYRKSAQERSREAYDQRRGDRYRSKK